MNINTLIGKRALITSTKAAYSADKIQEIKFIELAPSGNWVKIMDGCGKKYWKPVTEISLIEVLKDLTNGTKHE